MAAPAPLADDQQQALRAGLCICGCKRQAALYSRFFDASACKQRAYRQRNRPGVRESLRAIALRSEAHSLRLESSVREREAADLLDCARALRARAARLEAEAAGQLSIFTVLPQPAASRIGIRCRVCGAAPGERCRSLQGRRLPAVHVERGTAA